MKPKVKPNTWSAASAFDLYPEDLENLWNLLAGVTETVTAETPDFEDIQSYKELLSIPDERIPSLTITGYEAGHERAIEIQLDQRSASIWIVNSSAKLVGAMTFAQHVFWRRAAHSVVSGGVIFAMGFFLTMMGTISASRGQLDAIGGWPYLAVSIGVMSAGLAWAWRARRAFVRIYLHPRPGFWQRGIVGRREELIIAVAGGLVGTIVGGALLFLLDRLFPP